MRSILPFVLPLFFLSSCGGKSDASAQRQPPLVTPVTVEARSFVDRIEAIGTARAKEQVTLSAPVTERILRINFQDGGYVARGQVVAVLAQGQETAQLAEASARAREAEQQLARLNSLKQRGFATNSSVDSQAAMAASARAQAASANASIGDRVIRAPFGGWASLRTVSAGAVVTAGTEIATISDLSQIKLDFPIPETMLLAVAAGQPIEARAAAFADQPFRGTIATIDPVVDPATRSVMIRALLPNPGQKLKPGMLMTVTIEAATRTSPAVPERAIVGEGEQRYVFVLGSDGAVKRTPVKTGLRADGFMEITEGLKPGQKIVGDGVVKVRDGMKVRTPGMANARPPGRTAAP